MTLPTASVQLYTIATDFAANPEASLTRLAAIGLRTVEAFDFVDDPRRIVEALRQSGLTAPTGHAPLLSDALWTPDGSIPTPEPERVFEAAANIGIGTVIDPFVDPNRWLTPQDVAELANRMNDLAEQAATFGLSVGYHNHAQEFVAEFEGVSAYEHFCSLLDPQVRLELDLFWAQAGGQDVPALVRRLGARVVAIHVKDGVPPKVNPWVPGSAPFSSADLDQRRCGEGDVPLPESLRAATSLSYAVIEYDHAPGDVFEDIASSYAYLNDGGFVAQLN